MRLLSIEKALKVVAFVIFVQQPKVHIGITVK